MSTQTFTMMFKDEESYNKYKKEVINCGGAIKNDLGTTLLGFIAVIPPSLALSIQESNLVGQGIMTFEPDSKVTTQNK